MTHAVAIQDSTKVQNFEKKFYKKEEEKDYFKIFSHYVQSSVGTYKLFKLLRDGCRWPIHFAAQLGLNVDFVKKLFNVENRFKFIYKNLILAKFPGTLVGLNKSYKDFQKADIQDITRKRDKLSKKVVETIADFSFLVQLGEVLSLYSLGVISPVANLSGNLFMFFFHTLNLKMDSEDYIEHDKMQKVVETQKKPVKRLQVLFHEIKKLDLLKIAKSIASIALSVFLLIEMIFKTALVSATTLLVFSTAAIVFSIWAHFYQETMTYPLMA